MAPLDDLQTSIFISVEALGVAERQVDVGLSSVRFEICGPAIIAAAADRVAVPAASRIPTRPCQQLVVVEIDRIGSQALALKVEHLRMRQHIHQERNVT